MQGGAEEITKAVIDAAKAGDLTAAKIILDRLMPPAKERPINVDLPDTKTAEGVSAAQSAILQAVAGGDLLPGEATTLSAIVESKRRAIETLEMSDRKWVAKAKRLNVFASVTACGMSWRDKVQSHLHSVRVKSATSNDTFLFDGIFVGTSKKFKQITVVNQFVNTFFRFPSPAPSRAQTQLPGLPNTAANNGSDSRRPSTVNVTNLVLPKGRDEAFWCKRAIPSQSQYFHVWEPWWSPTCSRARTAACMRSTTPAADKPRCTEPPAPVAS